MVIDTWYNLFQAKLLAMAYHVGYTADEAKDIVQQFFLDLLQKNIKDDIKNPEAYVVTAFKRRLIDLYRSHRRKLGPVQIQELYVPSTQEMIEKLESDEALVNKIAAAYKKLPARCRRVIYMKYYQGLSTEKIVALTGFSTQTVYNNLSKGIQYLRKNLNEKDSFAKLALFLPPIF